MLFLREQDRRRDESARCSGRGTGARVTSAPLRREQQRRAPRTDRGALLSWTTSESADRSRAHACFVLGNASAVTALRRTSGGRPGQAGDAKRRGGVRLACLRLRSRQAERHLVPGWCSGSRSGPPGSRTICARSLVSSPTRRCFFAGVSPEISLRAGSGGSILQIRGCGRPTSNVYPGLRRWPSLP
jgi:hypothetical protein